MRLDKTMPHGCLKMNQSKVATKCVFHLAFSSAKKVEEIQLFYDLLTINIVQVSLDHIT